MCRQAVHGWIGRSRSGDALTGIACPSLWFARRCRDQTGIRESRRKGRRSGESCLSMPSNGTVAFGAAVPPRAAGIHAGIVSSDVMLVLVTRGALESDHVAREVGLAAHRRLPMLPVLLHGST